MTETVSAGAELTGQGNGDGRRAGSFTINMQRTPAGNVVVHLAGELLTDAALAIRRTLAEELERSPARLAIDLSDVTRIAAPGLDALVSAAAAAGESDISFSLIGVHGSPVEEAIAAAELTDLFEIFSSVTDAWEASR